jgi:hypothetical protein
MVLRFVLQVDADPVGSGHVHHLGDPCARGERAAAEQQLACISPLIPVVHELCQPCGTAPTAAKEQAQMPSAAAALCVGHSSRAYSSCRLLLMLQPG